MSAATKRPLVIGSRASKLAQIQAEIVKDALSAEFPDQEFQIQLMTTEGDKNQSQALYLVGGKAFWTKDLEVGLLDKSIDLLVHSLKDVPTTLPEGCAIGAISEREDPRDALVVKKGLSYKRLEDLPDGSIVGTSSVRRVAQLKRSSPKLQFLDLRGNLNTRLAKLDAADGPYTAIILAAAGLLRLGFSDRITDFLGPPTLFPAVGQAALGVEIRLNDPHVAGIVSKISHWRTEWTCRGERACLRVLEGGCSVPVGISSTLMGELDGSEKALRMTCTVTALDGSLHVEQSIEGPVKNAEDAEELGEKLARALVENGADKILDDVKRDREAKQAQSAQ